MINLKLFFTSLNDCVGTFRTPQTGFHFSQGNLLPCNLSRFFAFKIRTQMKQILLSKENAIMNQKLLQPDQLPLSAPDHRAARQLREKVLMSENYIKSILIKNRAGGENVARFDHEPASSIWAAHSSQLPGESGWTRKNSCHQRIVFKVLSKLLPGLESGRTGNGGRGVTGEHLQVSFFPPEAR